MEKDLGHLFITISSSHFFNKTDFKQYLLTITKNTCIKIDCLVQVCMTVCAFCASKKGVSETDCQVALVLTTCFQRKIIGLVLCGISVACNFFKTMTTDKLYQRFDMYVNLHTEFNLARYQTTLFVEFWFRKNRTTYYIKLAFCMIVIISQLRCFLTFAGQSFNILIVLRASIPVGRQFFALLLLSSRRSGGSSLGFRAGSL